MCVWQVRSSTLHASAESVDVPIAAVRNVGVDTKHRRSRHRVAHLHVPLTPDHFTRNHADKITHSIFGQAPTRRRTPCGDKKKNDASLITPSTGHHKHTRGRTHGTHVPFADELLCFRPVCGHHGIHHPTARVRRSSKTPRIAVHQFVVRCAARLLNMMMTRTRVSKAVMDAKCERWTFRISSSSSSSSSLCVDVISHR